MKISDIIKCERVKGPLGRGYAKPAEYKASTVNAVCEARGATREEAMTGTLNTVLYSVQHEVPMYYASPDHTMWVLYYAYGSWRYDMVRYAGDEYPIHMARISACAMPGDEHTVKRKMLEHKNEYDRDLYCPRRRPQNER